VWGSPQGHTSGMELELLVAEKVKRYLDLPPWVSCEIVAGP
jgi:hypothetical protein